ncbi:MAG TPA: NAD(P)H-hydrate dehydratase [Candidatus Eisenbergiella merdipullorum]|uniref:Bifunctional NAD(P)H-hydrate repair enzyme n=1 Tax=Candidatus Eisenbergiella merdipullorum TaxID=2838553 RepID=A0A9D2IAW4_9FIRM|nr:NAD(P)H-hydrate dehydratase [Candidatus Eisenbergiella merdipullorum]
MDDKRMEYLVTASEMKECDRNTTEKFGIPSLVLMERAALACADAIIQETAASQTQAVSQRWEAPQAHAPAERKKPRGRRTLIVSGCGNNGGDGFAAGRLLMQEGFPVDFWLVGERSRCSPETEKQISILENYGCTVMEHAPEREYDIIVDAIFGIGLRSAPAGLHEEAVEYINRSGAFVLSVDIPSGVSADSGAVPGCAVRADVTVTFAFLKRGLVLYPGALYAGRVLTVQIGITQESFLGKLPKAFTFRKGICPPLPRRERDGNKGTFGKVLLAAGSCGMAGAAVLSSSAVLRSGAGMVRVLSGEENRMILQTAVPEAMLALYGQDVDGGWNTAAGAFRKAEGWADVIAAGPGLGTGEDAKGLVRLILTETAKPLVLDADGINLLAADRNFLETFCLQRKRESAPPLILTPHPGELSRLTGLDVERVVSDPVSVCREWAAKLNAVLLCKGAATVVLDPSARCYINRSGNSGMATAGSGDVLTGIIAGLLAQGMEPFEAACSGVCLHGLAGDAAAERASEYSISAGKILEALDMVFKKEERQ